MRAYYKPTENSTLKNYHFRDMRQGPEETFTAFCSRVALEAGHCTFKCNNDNCTAEETATRDQIVIGTRYQNIREEALLKSWDLPTLRSEGMKMESAMKGGNEIGGEDINRLGKYSHKNNKNRSAATKPKTRNIACYRCGEKFTNLQHHQRTCKGLNNTCSNCSKLGHLPHVCKSKPAAVKTVETCAAQDNEDTGDEDTYNINLFVINSSRRSPKPKLRSAVKNRHDFSAQVIINTSLDRVLADTGAKVSVCGTVEAKKWGILDKLIPSAKKIHPYKVNPFPYTVRHAVLCHLAKESSQSYGTSFLDHVNRSFLVLHLFSLVSSSLARHQTPSNRSTLSVSKLMPHLKRIYNRQCLNFRRISRDLRN